MEQLSDKILLNIIAYLPTVRDLLRFKQVNKRLYSIVDKLNLESILVSHGKLPLNQRWFRTCRPINSYVLKMLDYSVLRCDSPTLSGLKQLQIISTDFSNFERYNLKSLFNQISSLTRLEHLELIGLMMEKSNLVELNSSSLHTLNIERVELARITLNTPNLKFLRVDLFESYDNKIHFSHPQSIQLLITNFYEKKSITSLSNLQYLYICQKFLLKDIQEDEVPGRLDSLFLNKLPSLKELQFYLEVRTLHHLAEQKRLLKRDTLRLFFCGVELVDDDLELLPKTDWSPYTTLSHIVIEFYAEHHRRTASILPFAKRLIYDDIGHCLHKLPKELMNKFVNLCSCEVNGPVGDVAMFANFLKCFKGLKTLHVEKSNLSQDFFNELPQLQPVLDRLEINTDEDLDFDFILQFVDVNFLYIDKSLSIDFVYSVFEKFGDLRFFFFFSVDNEISLNAVGRKFEFCVGQQKPVEFSDLNKLFDHFNEINPEELSNLCSDYEMDFESELDDLDDDLDELLC